MLCVVSGQTVVHSESSKPSRMTLPRNWLSDIACPNWFTSRKSGAGEFPTEVPRSMFGFDWAATLSGLVALIAVPEDADEVDADEHPASAATPRAAASSASAPRRRRLGRLSGVPKFTPASPPARSQPVSLPGTRLLQGVVVRGYRASRSGTPAGGAS